MNIKRITLAILIFCTLESCAGKDIETQQKPKLNRISLTEETGVKLQNFFSQEASYQRFSGVALVESNDSIVYKQTLGKATSSGNRNDNLRFEIGSITKQFTAAAILQLVQHEKLALSDNINLHLGSLSSKEWKKVTIHQLLTHTSGIPSIYQTEQGLEIFFPEEAAISLADLVNRFKDHSLLFSPGEEFSYSNSGYVLLAAVIEEKTGMTYHEYLEKNIFDKYGLESTSFTREGNTTEPFYEYRADLSKRAPIYHPSWSFGAGGAYSTVEDLARWAKLIQSDSFLTENLRKEFLKSHTRQGYGYGWQFDQNGRIQHDGGTAGYMSFLSIDPSQKTVVVLLTNQGFEDIHKYGKSARYLSDVLAKTWNILSNEEVEVLPEIVKTNFQKKRSYRLDDKIKIDFTPGTDTSVVISVDGSLVTRILPSTPLKASAVLEEKMLAIGERLHNSDYWKLAKYCDGEMKFVCYSGLMRIGMKMMKKQTGKITETVPYFAAENHGLIRMIGEDGTLDMIVYFNDANEVQGIFEYASISGIAGGEMIAYPIGENRFFVDGHPYGEPSCEITIQANKLTISQLGREVVATEQ